MIPQKAYPEIEIIWKIFVSIALLLAAFAACDKFFPPKLESSCTMMFRFDTFLVRLQPGAGRKVDPAGLEVLIQNRETGKSGLLEMVTDDFPWRKFEKGELIYLKGSTPGRFDVKVSKHGRVLRVKEDVEVLAEGCHSTSVSVQIPLE